MSKELNFDDRKQVQLDMLIEIDAFCREHSIKYALSCGTLIGAIRHKGFIPWDDDVDITMPYIDMMRFLQLFKSANMKICDVDNCCNYLYPFPRIASTKTYSKYGFKNIDYGVCIDLYPIIECSNDRNKINDFINQASKVLKSRLRLIFLRKLILKTLPIHDIKWPFFSKYMKNYRDLFYKNLLSKEKPCSYYQIGGPLNIFYKNFWDFNPFEDLIEVDFEGYKFYAPKRYDEFLKVRYGDYMVLPPEDKRVPYHCGNYYWK